MEEMCKKHNVELEYTALHTPQMNELVERRIAIRLLNGPRAAMHSANFNAETRKKLWAEAINYTEAVHNSMATSRSVKGANELFYGKKASFQNHMVEFGRVGYVTKREKILGRLEDHAVKCVFVGYGKNHSGDTYRIYNPTTKRIILSHDVK